MNEMSTQPPADGAADPVAPVSSAAAGRVSTRVKIAAPAAIALVAVAAVPLVLDGDDDTLRTSEVAEPTEAPSTTESARNDPVFTSAGVTVEETTTTSSTSTSAPTSSTTTTDVVDDADPEIVDGEAEAIIETLPEQPVAPIAPPADPRGFEEQVQLGGISIPKLDVEAPLLEGIRLTTLDNGPGHWPGTAMPGEVGNVVVAAHRTSHGGPFRHIDQLVEGDSVFFQTDGGEVEYAVTSTQIVGPDALWIVDPSDDATATLFACHPPGSVAQRIVVKLELA